MLATKFTASLLCLLSFTYLFSGNDVSSFSLEELFAIDVETASKKREHLFDAPGIVTVITQTEITDFGAMNVAELMERVPGMLSFSSFILPNNSFAIRGDFPGHTNPHILFLLNGRPIRESLVGGFNADILTSFPISAISRIEVVRGPGSVLYGTNAYAGVVNIITDDERDPTLSVSFGGGSESAGFASLSAAARSGRLTVSADAYRFRDQGWNFGAQLTPDRFTQQDYSDDIVSARLGLKYGKFGLSAFFTENTQQKITAGAFPSGSRQKRLFVDLSYEDNINDRWQYGVNATTSLIRNILPTGDNVEAFPESEDMVLETTHHIAIRDHIDLVIGSSLYQLAGEWRGADAPTVPEYDERWWNVYGQVDASLSKNIKLIAGGQLNKPENVDLDFVPRLGSVFRFDARWGAKLLYGEAFRAAFPGETQIRIPRTLLGKPDLTPETIATLDAQVFFEAEQIQVSLTWFDSHQENLITRIPSPDPDFRLEFANRGELDSHGVEIDAKYIPSMYFYLIGSMTHYESEHSSGIENPSLLPETLFKIGVSFAVPQTKARLSLFHTHTSDPASVRRTNPDVSEVGPEPSGFDLLSANLAWQKSLERGRELSVRLYGTNLLDDEVYYPEYIFRRINSVPGRAGRQIYASLGFSF